MPSSTTRLQALALVLSLAATGCDQLGTGPDRGETSILLSQSSSASASLAPSFAISALSEMAGPVALSDVKSIDVTITKVQALPASADTSSEAEWVSFDVTTPGTVNLLALPATAESGIQLARGELPEGEYRSVRLFFSEGATVTFSRDVTVAGGPAARTFVADSVYPLEIPSAAQTGIKVPTAGFTVGSTVAILFDGSASVKKVIATPKGVRMPPVLSAKRVR